MKKRDFNRWLSVAGLAVLINTTISPVWADDDGDDDEHHEDNRQEREEMHGSSGGGMQSGMGSSSGHNENHEEDEEENEENALQAVQSEEALHLRDIIKLFREQIGGEIIDIALYKRRLKLVYRFQYIDSEGRVAFVIYEAATGKRLEG